MDLYLIRSTEETTDGFTPAWWNEGRKEWTHADYATIYTDGEVEDGTVVPITGEWVQFTEVEPVPESEPGIDPDLDRIMRPFQHHGRT